MGQQPKNLCNWLGNVVVIWALNWKKTYHIDKKQFGWFMHAMQIVWTWRRRRLLTNPAWNHETFKLKLSGAWKPLNNLEVQPIGSSKVSQYCLLNGDKMHAMGYWQSEIHNRFLKLCCSQSNQSVWRPGHVLELWYSGGPYELTILNSYPCLTFRWWWLLACVAYRFLWSLENASLT